MVSRRYAITIALVVAAAVLAVGWFWGDRLASCLRALWAMYGSPEAIRAFVAGFGSWAPPIFIGVQALQVVLSPIPGEATGVLGGYLFGTWVGLLYSMLGLTLGSALAFALSRWLGFRLVRRIIPTAAYEMVLLVGSPQGVAVAFLLFLIPGFPKEYLSYLLGLTPHVMGELPPGIDPRSPPRHLALIGAGRCRGQWPVWSAPCAPRPLHRAGAPLIHLSLHDPAVGSAPVLAACLGFPPAVTAHP